MAYASNFVVSSGAPKRPESACAVKRRRFPVGVRPTRRFRSSRKRSEQSWRERNGWSLRLAVTGCPRECAGRNASERRASLEKVDVQADPTAESGKAEMAGGDERGLRPAAAPGDWRQAGHKESARTTGS